MNQVFGTANTGGELFVVALIYSRADNFAEVKATARDSIARFSIDVDGHPEYRCVGDVDVVTDRALAGERVCVLRSMHERTGSELRRAVYTFVLDTVSHDARAARRQKTDAEAGKKPANKAGKTPTRKTPKKATKNHAKKKGKRR
jgi:hypothetical protein